MGYDDLSVLADLESRELGELTRNLVMTPNDVRIFMQHHQELSTEFRLRQHPRNNGRPGRAI